MSCSVNSFNNWKIDLWLVVSSLFYFVVVIDAIPNSSTTSRPLCIPRIHISRRLVVIPVLPLLLHFHFAVNVCI